MANETVRTAHQSWNGEQILPKSILYFEKVARYRSIRKASDSLHIAASAIDRQILMLERELEAPLFVRSPRGLDLTAAGEALIHAVRQSRADLHSTASRIDKLRTMQEGLVSVGLVEGSIQTFSDAAGAFQERFPGIKFRLRTDGANAIVAAVLDGACDLALVFNPPVTSALRVHARQQSNLSLIVPPDHRLAGRGDVSFTDFSEEHLILPDTGLSLRDAIDRVWEKALGHRPRHFAEVGTKDILKLMVVQGLGVSILPPVDAVEELRAGTLLAIPLPEADIAPSILSLVSASNRSLSLGASAFLEVATATVSGHGEIKNPTQPDAAL
jgi:DNA-binding transcriptional LysR family regulator